MSYIKNAEFVNMFEMGMVPSEVVDYWVNHGARRDRIAQRVQREYDKWYISDTATEVGCDNTQEPVVLGTLLPVEDTRMVSTDKTFILTCAQSNTFLNTAFWKTLKVIAEERGASIHVSRFTYNKAAFGSKSVKPGSKKASDTDDLWYDPEIMDYVSDDSLEIAPGLVWCGELNLSPTLVNPSTGFDNYGRGASIVIPSTKISMRSVPTMKDDPARFIYSTGTVTARNYIEKAAGQRASHHHVYGALLVEVDDDGTWFARQLNADTDGVVYDLNKKYSPDGTVESGVRAAVITHGDIHGNKANIKVLDTMSRVIDVLYPRNQVFHDIVDFQPRNHHNIKDPHFLHDMWESRTESVADEFRDTSNIVANYLARPDTSHWIITSNHDQAIEGWLRNTSGFFDPPNMETWLDMNLYCAKERKAGRKPRPFAEMMRRHLRKEYHWHVVHEDESLMIAGIENGLHGHLGPNGARGNPKNLRSVGKANTGHTHSAGIVDGVYTCGVFGNLDMGYNKGLSGWSHSFIVTYPNGKRTVVTIKGDKAWR